MISTPWWHGVFQKSFKKKEKKKTPINSSIKKDEVLFSLNTLFPAAGDCHRRPWKEENHKGTKTQSFFWACLSYARQTKKAYFVSSCLCGAKLLCFLRQLLPAREVQRRGIVVWLEESRSPDTLQNVRSGRILCIFQPQGCAGLLHPRKTGHL